MAEKLACIITHDILMFILYTLKNLFRLSKNKQKASVPCVFLEKQIWFFMVTLRILFSLSRSDYSF